MKKNSLGFSPAAQGQGERGKSATDAASKGLQPQRLRAPGRPSCHPLGQKKYFWLSKDLELACLKGSDKH